jgi:trans-2,3-dihydro-3-hydroxyanthranilate isomerase
MLAGGITPPFLPQRRLDALERRRYGDRMRDLAFRILNVFTDGADRLSGNPLAVFEDGRELDDGEMLALARQLNLSETTFLLPARTASATARVRIFTPSFEMPFAGHPTLGSAHVVRALGASDHVSLEMKAGVVEVRSIGDRWTLRAAVAPTTRRPEASRIELSRMLGHDEDVLAGEPLWVDTGAEQLVLPLRDVADVAAARPDAVRLARDGFSGKRGASMAYAWARQDAATVVARFFFISGGGVVEDPATGSACANLGGYFIATAAALPIELTVLQGRAVQRPSRLGLRVSEDEGIYVSGDVIEIARGTLRL